MNPLLWSMRARVFLSVFLICVTFTTIFSAVLYLSSEKLEHEYVDKLVADELGMIYQHELKNSTYFPNSVHIKSYQTHNHNVPAELMKYDIGEHREIMWHNEVYHLSVTEFKEGFLYLLINIDIIETYEKGLHQTIIYLAILSLMLFFIALFVINDFISKPIRQLAQDISQLSAYDTKIAVQAEDTELKVIEEAINGYTQQIARYLKQEEQFSGVVSHELRTPISTILATVETLIARHEKQAEMVGLKTGAATGIMKDATEDLTAKQLQRIFRNTKEMQYVTESLLAFVKFSPEATQQEAAWCLGDMAEELIDEYQVLKRNDQVALLLYKQKKQLREPKVIVKLIVSNLVRNALQNINAGTVSLHIEDTMLSVRDTGVGMSPQQIRAFNNATEQINHLEYGLGLMLVARLCRKIGWRVEIISNASKGIDVNLYLNGE